MKWNNNQFRSIWMNGEHYMQIDQCDAIGLTTVRMLCYSNESERVSEWTSQKCLTQFRNRRKFWPRYRIESRWLKILYAFFTDIYQFDYNFMTFISFEKKTICRYVFSFLRWFEFFYSTRLSVTWTNMQGNFLICWNCIFSEMDRPSLHNARMNFIYEITCGTKSNWCCTWTLKGNDKKWFRSNAKRRSVVAW